MNVVKIVATAMFSGHQVEVEYDDGNVKRFSGSKARKVWNAIQEVLNE